MQVRGRRLVDTGDNGTALRRPDIQAVSVTAGTWTPSRGRSPLAFPSWWSEWPRASGQSCSNSRWALTASPLVTPPLIRKQAPRLPPRHPQPDPAARSHARPATPPGHAWRRVKAETQSSGCLEESTNADVGPTGAQLGGQQQAVLLCKSKIKVPASLGSSGHVPPRPSSVCTGRALVPTLLRRALIEPQGTSHDLI